MTNLLAYLAANWLMFAIALVFLILMAAIGIAVSGWYLWRWFFEIHAEPKLEPLPNYAFGDVIHRPDNDYWNRVADVDHAKAKREAG